MGSAERDLALLPIQNFFNVWAVNVVLTDSGVDNDPSLGIDRDTALDSYFFCSGIERLLCGDGEGPRVRDSRPGGRPHARHRQLDQVRRRRLLGPRPRHFFGRQSVLSRDRRARAGPQHRTAHDEYDFADGTVYSGKEPTQINVSTLTEATQLATQSKWWRWMGEAEHHRLRADQYVGRRGLRAVRRIPAGLGLLMRFVNWPSTRSSARP